MDTCIGRSLKEDDFKWCFRCHTYGHLDNDSRQHVGKPTNLLKIPIDEHFKKVSHKFGSETSFDPPPTVLALAEYLVALDMSVQSYCEYAALRDHFQQRFLAHIGDDCEYEGIVIFRRAIAAFNRYTERWFDT